MSILDWLTLASYIALNIDIVFQTARIYRTKSSNDLSLVGMTIRFVAILIILFKFLSLGDTPLIIGQGIAVVTFSTYFTMAITYFRFHKKSAAK